MEMNTPPFEEGVEWKIRTEMVTNTCPTVGSREAYQAAEQLGRHRMGEIAGSHTRRFFMEGLRVEDQAVHVEDDGLRASWKLHHPRTFGIMMRSHGLGTSPCGTQTRAGAFRAKALCRASSN